MADYEEEHGHAPGERASYALACRAVDRTRPPKHKELRSLSKLRGGWREPDDEPALWQPDLNSPRAYRIARHTKKASTPRR